MAAVLRGFVLIVSIVLFLGGCDDFSLTEQFGVFPVDPGGTNPTSDLAITLSQTTMRRNQTISHTTSGGTEPYTYSVQAEDLAYTGVAPGYISSTQFTAADSMGQIRLRVSDGDGNTASAIVTVLPDIPGSFSAENVEESTVTVTWDNNITDIDGFKLYRRESGDSDFGVPQELGVNSQPYIDAGTMAEKTYYYYLTSYVGAYESERTSIIQVTISN